MSRARRIAVPTLLVLGTLFLFVGVFSVWVNRQVLDTDNWVDTSGKLLADPHIEEQLSKFLIAQAYENADVEAELKAALPPMTQQLAGPLAGGLRQLSERVAERALDSPAFQGLWEEANRSAHEALLKILDGGGSFVSTGEGTVTLNLHDLLEGVIEQAGLPTSVLEKLPPEAGNLTVLESSQLSAAQKVAKLIRHLPIVLILLMALCYGAAIYLARGRRREIVRAAGFGFVIAGVAALAVRGIAGNAVVGALAATDPVEEAAGAAWGIGTSLLVEVALSTLLFGVLLVIGAWTLGSTALARGLRRQAAPGLREKPGLAYVALGLLWLALIAWVPIAAFRTWIGVLVFALLFAAGAAIFRRETLDEFPDAERQSFGKTMRTLRAAVGGGRTEPAPSAAPADPVERLERLNALRDEGALSPEEFEAAKRKVLAAP
jgi:putative oligomerization/nucleic acid binding protein